jgi:hypothetical protein
MAVYQISRIQLRRGKEQDSTGLPQLASGELAWAIDTQKLYIGNGSVAEGAPAVGNTQILTINDLSNESGLIGRLNYVYKISDPTIQTGETPTSPVSRTLQERLDDQITAADFDVMPASSTNGLYLDSTRTLQRAIDQLFANTPTANATNLDGSDLQDAVLRRVTLNIGPGVYNIRDTIRIPSFATIVGAGSDKTIFKFDPKTTLSVTGTTNNSPIIETAHATVDMKGATITPDSNYSSYISAGVGIVNDTSFTGHISNSNPSILTVDSIGAGAVLSAGQMLLGIGIIPNTYLVGQTGPTTWQLNNHHTTNLATNPILATGVVVSSTFTGSITGTTLTVTHGTAAAGQLITGQGVSPNTYIINSINSSHWVVSVSQSVASTTITGTGKISMTSPALANSGSSLTLNLALSGSAFKGYDQVAGYVKNIQMKGLTIESVNGNNTCLELNSVIESEFEDLVLKGNSDITPSYPTAFNVSNSGIILKSSSVMYPCKHNVFFNIKFKSVSFAVYGPRYVMDNTFKDLEVNHSYHGVVLGYNYTSQYDATTYSEGASASNNLILSSKFSNIWYYAASIGVGTGNTIDECSLIGVGNSGTPGIYTGNRLYPQIYINKFGNKVSNIFSDRTNLLANLYVPPGGGAGVLTVPYVPEVSGQITYSSYSALQVTGLTYQTGVALIGSPFVFRLPVSTDITGAPMGMASYVINYTYVSSSYSFVRRGTLTISSSIVDNGSYIANIQTSDEYEFAGPDDSHQLKLEFTAVYLNDANSFYTGTGIPSGIAILYSNSLADDLGTLEYDYTVSFSN